MQNFTINVSSDNENGKIPVVLAGQVMLDIQQFIVDIGEYYITKEMKIQKSIKNELLNRFLLYLDGSGAISLNASASNSTVPGRESLLDETIEMLNKTLSELGSGKGGYWVQDNFSDPFYRSHIIYDIVGLWQHVSAHPGCSLLFGNPESLQKMNYVDAEKLLQFIKEKGFSDDGTVIAKLTSTPSKAKGDIIKVEYGNESLRIGLPNNTVLEKARANLNVPVYITGKLSFSKDGSLVEIRDVTDIVPADTIKFTRIISSEGDMKLSKPVEGKITQNSDGWVIKNEDLGITVSKPTWDETVMSFHDYFIFLWTEYGNPDKQLEGEEAEIRTILQDLVN